MSALASATTTDTLPPWQARLALSFRPSDHGTAMYRLGQIGPLAVQRPFFPEGKDVCHVVLLHPPGGVVPGDVLDVVLEVEADAHALVTTPAATKVYRSDGRLAEVRQTLKVSTGAALEWLPQETILFDGANALLHTRIDLGRGASFIGWDVLCLGRPAAGESAFSGACRQHLDLFVDERPLLLERADYGRRLQFAPWGLRGASVCATFFATGPCLSGDASAPLLTELRHLAESEHPDGAFRSATVMRDVLVLRYLGSSAEAARGFFDRAWRLVRPAVLGRPACPPRIWST